MKFRLHDWPDEMRKRALKFALKYPMDTSLSASVKISKGWRTLPAEFRDTTAKKYVLCSGGFYRKAKDGEIVALPSFSANFHPFLFIHVEAGANVSIIDDYGFPKASPLFRCAMVFLENNAKVKWLQYQHHPEKVESFSQKRFFLKKNAGLDFFQNIIGGGLSHDETLVELVGMGAEAHSETVFFGHRKQREEMRVTHVHIGKFTRSTMISKGAVKGESLGSFFGMIRMEPGCDGALGYLKEHNLLLSDTAKINAVPGLEISHHNVKAGHAVTMERVDEEKLFYLASRGILKSDAIKLIVEGFFIDSIRKMNYPIFERRVLNHIFKEINS